jgi:hypothetical protein
MISLAVAPSCCLAGTVLAATVIPPPGVIGPRRRRADQEKPADREGRGPRCISQGAKHNRSPFSVAELRRLAVSPAILYQRQKSNDRLRILSVSPLGQHFSEELGLGGVFRLHVRRPGRHSTRSRSGQPAHHRRPARQVRAEGADREKMEFLTSLRARDDLREPIPYGEANPLDGQEPGGRIP